MNTGLRGKTAPITGGSSGIGKGIALAEEGVDLAVAGRSPDPAALEEMRAKGVRCLRIQADVSREEDAVRMVQETVDGGLALRPLPLLSSEEAFALNLPVREVDP